MLITEFRVPMPLTSGEYERGLLYTCMEASKRVTTKGEGVQILVNEPFDNFPLLGDRFRRGQYTKKLYHLASRLPRVIVALAPKSALTLCEESWNAYPYCRTVLSNQRMGQDFLIQIDTFHVDKSRGEIENIHELDENKLKARDVIFLDIGNDELPSDWTGAVGCDPAKFVSNRTKRGPLTGSWKDKTQPVMTCYKLVTAQFKWFGLQSAIEKFIIRTEGKLFLQFHKQMFCWIDEWIDMKIADIKKLEDDTKDQLAVMMRVTSDVDMPSSSLATQSSYKNVSPTRKAGSKK